MAFLSDQTLTLLAIAAVILSKLALMNDCQGFQTKIIMCDGVSTFS